MKNAPDSEGWHKLTYRTQNALNSAGIASRAEAIAAINEGRLRPEIGLRGYGKVTHSEVVRWLGIPSSESWPINTGCRLLIARDDFDQSFIAGLGVELWLHGDGSNYPDRPLKQGWERRLEIGSRSPSDLAKCLRGLADFIEAGPPVKAKKQED